MPTADVAVRTMSRNSGLTGLLLLLSGHPALGHRLRQAGLLGSMGRVASSVDNALIESFWSVMQRELLDRTTWDSRAQLASAMFEWIEGFYNPRRQHSALDYLSPADYEALHHTAEIAA